MFHVEQCPPCAGFSLSKIKLAYRNQPCTMSVMKGNKPNHKRVIIMSYKDLEAEIKAWANIEQHAKEQKVLAEEKKRQAKRDKRAAKLTAPLIPKVAKEVQAPINTKRRVRMNVRNAQERVWGDITEVFYDVNVPYQTEAELAAIKQASAQGWHWVETLSIEEI